MDVIGLDPLVEVFFFFFLFSMFLSLFWDEVVVEAIEEKGLSPFLSTRNEMQFSLLDHCLAPSCHDGEGSFGEFDLVGL